MFYHRSKWVVLEGLYRGSRTGVHILGSTHRGSRTGGHILGSTGEEIGHFFVSLKGIYNGINNEEEDPCLVAKSLGICYCILETDVEILIHVTRFQKMLVVMTCLSRGTYELLIKATKLPISNDIYNQNSHFVIV